MINARILSYEGTRGQKYKKNGKKKREKERKKKKGKTKRNNLFFSTSASLFLFD